MTFTITYYHHLHCPRPHGLCSAPNISWSSIFFFTLLRSPSLYEIIFNCSKCTFNRSKCNIKCLGLFAIIFTFFIHTTCLVSAVHPKYFLFIPYYFCCCCCIRFSAGTQHTTPHPNQSNYVKYH